MLCDKITSSRNQQSSFPRDGCNQTHILLWIAFYHSQLARDHVLVGSESHRVALFTAAKCELTEHDSFAWTEMIKTIATLLRSFTIERIANGPTEIREGFFNKIGECNVRLHSRWEHLS